MSYRVLLSRSAIKELDALPPADYARIYAKIKALASHPRPPGCAKLGDDLFRVRSGHYRIVYHVDDLGATVLIARVVSRNERTYRRLPH